MFPIDDPTAAAVMPTPEAAGTAGFWTEGNPALGVEATRVRASWLNALQTELINILTAGGVTPSKTTYNQILTALNTLYSGGRLLSVQVFDTPGSYTYTPTTGTQYVIVEMVGGGGGSGGASAAGAGNVALAGGGAGAPYGKGKFTSGFAGVTVTVGARGAAGAAGGGGGAGGASSFGSLLSVTGAGASTGGAPSSLMYVTAAAGSGGTIVGANLFGSLGTEGGRGFNVTNSFSGPGGNSLMGNGAPGGAATGPGSQCDSPGGGGSGAAVGSGAGAQPGGAGGPGRVIVWEFA